MSLTVVEGVAQARTGTHPGLVCQVPSGWVVLADMQYLSGYCILLADPIAGSLNDVDGKTRAQFLADMAKVGDALLRVTGAVRINYAVMGNSDPYLHAHIVPRYASEPPQYLHNHPWSYPQQVISGRGLDADGTSSLIEELKNAIARE
jgi:diadenosine tetraphosphate (Ap4A) HIT family hydrolase